MKTLKYIGDHAEGIVASILLAASTIIIFLQIVLRVMGLPLAWSEEIARYMFIWMVYLGCATAIKQRRHISMELIDIFLKERGMLIINLFSNFMFLIFAFILTYYGFQVAMRVSTQVSAAVRLPMIIPYSSICISGGLMIFRLIEDTVLRCKEYKKSKVEKEEQENG